MSGRIRFTLHETLEELNISMTRAGMEARLRPGAVIDMVKGNTRRLPLDTVVQLLDTLNELSDRPLDLSDILVYEETKKEDSP